MKYVKYWYNFLATEWKHTFLNKQYNLALLVLA